MKRSMATVTLYLRLYRQQLVCWGAVMCVLFAINGIGYAVSFPTTADREILQTGMAEQNLTALLGPAESISNITEFNSWRLLLFSLFPAAWIITLAAKISRQSEENGQSNLIVARSVSMSQNLFAQLGFLLIASVSAGLGASLGTVLACLFDKETVDLMPTVGIGLLLSAYLWLFATLTLLAVQIGSSRTMAVLLPGGLLAVSYVMRGVGDTLTESGNTYGATITWLTPCGWLEKGTHNTQCAPRLFSIHCHRSHFRLARSHLFSTTGRRKHCVLHSPWSAKKGPTVQISVRNHIPQSSSFQSWFWVASRIGSNCFPQLGEGRRRDFVGIRNYE